MTDIQSPGDITPVFRAPSAVSWCASWLERGAPSNSWRAARVAAAAEHPWRAAVKQWMKFSRDTAEDMGEWRSPEIVILETYPDAEDLNLDTVAGAWFFRAAPLEGEPRAPFAMALRYQPPEAQ